VLGFLVFMGCDDNVFYMNIIQGKPSEKKGGPSVATEEPQSQRMFACSEVALTTWWFDRQIMTILTTNSLSSTRGWLSARLRNSARGLTGPPRQVVVVGSGFDARPWRMALPPMTTWLEIDSEDVVKAKLKGLEMCRAEIMPHSNTGYYPLRTARWDIHGADILGQDMDWAKVLSMYGFDLDQPIVWVVENILMYLPQDGVKLVLEELARVSSAGSLLIGNSTVNRNAELLSGHGPSHGSSYPGDIVDHWISSLPLDPQMVLREVGWDVFDSCTQFGIAEQVCVHGSMMMSGQVMESTDDEEVATDIYFVARKQS